MKQAPISPNLKVRDLTKQPRSPAELAILTLQQMQAGADEAAAKVGGVWDRVTGADPVVIPAKPFGSTTPRAAPPAQWRRNVSIAAAQARANLPDILRTRRFPDGRMSEEKIAAVVSGIR